MKLLDWAAILYNVSTFWKRGSTHVSYDQLWAPWRLAYVANSVPNEPGGCFLCRYRDENADAENFVVLRSGQALTVLNRYPYNNGHLLIAPRLHKSRLQDLTDSEHLACMQEANRLVTLLEERIKAQGFNLGLNLGHIAGAGIPGHLHWHIVPRWTGDNNFMPTLAGTHVIPQSLEALWEILTQALS